LDALVFSLLNGSNGFSTHSFLLLFSPLHCNIGHHESRTMNTPFRCYPLVVLLSCFVLGGCVYPPAKYDGIATRYRKKMRGVRPSTSSRSRVRKPRVAMRRKAADSSGVPAPTWPHLMQGHSVDRGASMFSRYGRNVLRVGAYFMERAHFLRKLCNRPGADSRTCRVYWRSQRIFSINYRTSRSNYRGYVTFHRRRKRRIPR